MSYGSKYWLPFAACLWISACSSLDDRTAVYSHLGADTVLMRPTFSAPKPGSRDHALNNFVFLPGVLLKPEHIVAEVDHERRRAAIWSSTKIDSCAPPPSLYSLNDVTEKDLPDVKINYDFEFSLRSFIDSIIRFDIGRIFRLSKPEKRLKDARDKFEFRENDVQYVKSITINITNLRVIEIGRKKLEEAFYALAQECPYLAKEWQVEKAYVADIEIDVKSLEGSSVNVQLLESKIRKRLSVRIQGKDQFFAINVKKNASI